LFSTEHLNISPHAVTQYARRVECLDVPEGYRFRSDEYRRYVRTMYDRIKHGDELPPHCCLIFVKPGNSTRRMKRSEATHHHQKKPGTWWGTYVFDGSACYVIENNFVVTVIVPTEEQLTLLESLLEKKKHGNGSNERDRADAQRDEPPMLEDARKLNRKCGPLASTPMPSVGDIELYVPNLVPVENGTPDARTLAKVLRWMTRANPRPEASVRLVIAPFFDPIAGMIECAFPKGSVRVSTLPNGIGVSGDNILQANDPAYFEALAMVSTVPGPFQHVFCLLSRVVFVRIYEMIDDTIVGFNPKDPIPRHGAVLRIDLKEPDRTKRATTFLLP